MPRSLPQHPGYSDWRFAPSDDLAQPIHARQLRTSGTGRAPVRGRNQLVLDFSREEVRDYIYELICDILDQGNVEYIKWDMNRSLSDIYSSKRTSGKRTTFHTESVPCRQHPYYHCTRSAAYNTSFRRQTGPRRRCSPRSSASDTWPEASP